MFNLQSNRHSKTQDDGPELPFEGPFQLDAKKEEAQDDGPELPFEGPFQLDAKKEEATGTKLVKSHTNLPKEIPQ